MSMDKEPNECTLRYVKSNGNSLCVKAKEGSEIKSRKYLGIFEVKSPKNYEKIMRKTDLNN